MEIVLRNNEKIGLLLMLLPGENIFEKADSASITINTHALSGTRVVDTKETESSGVDFIFLIIRVNRETEPFTQLKKISERERSSSYTHDFCSRLSMIFVTPPEKKNQNQKRRKKINLNQ